VASAVAVSENNSPNVQPGLKPDLPIDTRVGLLQYLLGDKISLLIVAAFDSKIIAVVGAIKRN